MNSKNTLPIVPFSDFEAAHNEVSSEVTSAIQRVLDRGSYILGSELLELEKELADWFGVPYVIGVGNGTDALVLAFLAVGTQSGDEIITTDFTAFPTITAIHQVGAVPIPVDIDPFTGLIAPQAIGKAITPKTRGIVPVHLYGRSCDMSAIKEIADSYGLWMIEDCAQSIGAFHAGHLTGTFGTFGAFSFYPTKNLGAYGDAGALICHDSELSSRVRSLRNYGQSNRDEHSECGVNSRLDELQAAILRAKLPHLASWNSRRRELAQRYRQYLPRTVLPADHDDDEHVYHLFPILVENRDEFRSALLEAGVETKVHYPLAVHQQPVFKGKYNSSFSSADQWSSKVVSLPLHPFLSDNMQEFIIEAINTVFDHDHELC